MEKVILSSPIIFEEGTYKVKKISLDEAINWVNKNNPVNYCGHQTVKILKIKPSNLRETCDRYEESLIIKPHKRLEFGKEYSIEEIEKIGYTIFLISKID